MSDTGGPSVHMMMYATPSPPEAAEERCKAVARGRQLDGQAVIQYF